jgi:uncharacterized membrane protein YgaE (UPF0421/DUF939 family)
MNKPNSGKKYYDTKNIYLAAWLFQNKASFSHTDIDRDERVHFYFEEFEKTKELTKKFYDDKNFSEYLRCLQDVKKMANETREHSEEFPK